MQLGVTTAYSYASHGLNVSIDDYIENIETLAQLGFKNFDLEIREAPDIPSYEDEQRLGKLLKATRKHEMNIVGFTAWACMEYIHSNLADEHEMGYAVFDRIARVASQFNAQYIQIGADMIHEYVVERDEDDPTAPATHIEIPKDVSLAQVLESYAKRLRCLAEIAASHDLKFALEPRINSLVTGVDAFNDIYEQVQHPNFYCCYDVMHGSFHQQDISLAIEKLGDRLLVFHACDAIPGQLEHLPLGQGQVHWDLVFKTLKKINFDGALLLDIFRLDHAEPKVANQWYQDGLAKLKASFNGQA